MECPTCNGELAKAMMRDCTPEQVAHAFVHVISEAQKLRATQAELLAALRDIANATPHDGTQPLATEHCERARAAIARAESES